jgi:hypothetical protein
LKGELQTIDVKRMGSYLVEKIVRLTLDALKTWDNLSNVYSKLNNLFVNEFGSYSLWLVYKESYVNFNVQNNGRRQLIHFKFDYIQWIWVFMVLRVLGILGMSICDTFNFG